MDTNREIQALLTLIDDPDEFVYEQVSNRICSYGKDIIPHLENYWEFYGDDFTQERIELLIHKLHFCELEAEIIAWKNDPSDLLKGGLIVSKFHYPDLDEAPVLKQFERIRKNIWLELNPYLTTLETANTFNSILYNFYKFKGVEVDYKSPEYFIPAHCVNNRKGNAFSMGIIYQSLCKALDIPVRAISIPRQYILAYFCNADFGDNTDHTESIKFFLDSHNGQLYSHNDLQNYFKKLNKEADEKYFQPLTNEQIIVLLMKELSKCYNAPENNYKQRDLNKLIAIFDN